MEPATYPVQLSVDYPDRPLDRLTTAFRLFTAVPILVVLGSVSTATWQSTTAGGTTRTVAAGAAIPHYVVLAFLSIGAVLGVIAAWFIILFTGRYPRRIFDFVEAVIRWWNRVVAYAIILVTDRYPPFRLQP